MFCWRTQLKQHQLDSISVPRLLDLRRLSIVKIWLGHLLADLLGGQRNLGQDCSALWYKSVVIGLVGDGHLLSVGIEVGVGAADLQVLVLGALVSDHGLLPSVGAVLAEVREVVRSILVLFVR